MAIPKGSAININIEYELIETSDKGHIAIIIVPIIIIFFKPIFGVINLPVIWLLIKLKIPNMRSHNTKSVSTRFSRSKFQGI